MTELVSSHELFAIRYSISRRANRSQKYQKVSPRSDAEVAADSSRADRRFSNFAEMNRTRAA
jgi:hypothetical protein